MERPSGWVAKNLYVEAQQRFVTYYVNLVQLQQFDQFALSVELPNLVVSLMTCLKHKWWYEMGTLLLVVGRVLVDQGYWRQYRGWLETILRTPEIALSQDTRELYLNLLDDYASVVNSYGEPERAQALYAQIIQLAKNDGLDDVLAYAYYGLGTSFFVCHQSEQAQAYWNEAVTIARRIGNQVIPAAVNYFLAPVHSDPDILSSVPETQKGFLTKLGNWQRYGKNQFLAYKLIRSGRYDEAEVTYKQIVTQAKELDDQQGLAIALFHLGNIAALQDSYDEAIRYFKESETIAVRMNDHIGLALVYSTIGLTYFGQGRFDLGRPYFEECVRLEREYGSTQSLAENLYWLGYALANTGDLEQAEASFQEAISIFKQVDPTQVKRVEATIHQLHAVLSSSI